MITLGLALLGAAQAAVAAPPAPLAIEHVTVIDVRTGRRLADRTVVLDGGRIVAVGRGGASPRAARLDGTGKFLIPGLWDMHVHAAEPGQDTLFAHLLLANGVTGVREMWGRMDRITAWRAGARSGPPWPRIVAAGAMVDGPPAYWPGSVMVSNPGDARRAVDSLRRLGADFVKIQSGLSPESFQTMLDAARRAGLRVAGHVPPSVGAVAASDAGLASFEHVDWAFYGCSRVGDSLRAELVAASADTSHARVRAVRRRHVSQLLEAQDAARCDGLLRRLAKNGSAASPTMIGEWAFAFGDDPTLMADPRLDYLPAHYRQDWNPAADFRLRVRTADEWAEAKRAYRLARDLVRRMDHAGLLILAGSDTPNPFCLPGFGIHDELMLYVEAGLTPLAALRTATLNPARFLGALDSLGTIEPGKVADLVLLDADPLVDIRNSRAIRAVIRGGHLVDRSALDAILARAKAIAAEAGRD